MLVQSCWCSQQPSRIAIFTQLVLFPMPFIFYIVELKKTCLRSHWLCRHSVFAFYLAFSKGARCSNKSRDPVNLTCPIRGTYPSKLKTKSSRCLNRFKSAIFSFKECQKIYVGFQKNVSELNWMSAYSKMSENETKLLFPPKVPVWLKIVSNLNRRIEFRTFRPKPALRKVNGWLLNKYSIFLSLKYNKSKGGSGSGKKIWISNTSLKI